MLTCEACGSDSVTTSQVDQVFTYGAGDNAVELTAAVPVYTCAACGLEYTDGAAEDLRHSAVCGHLGVLTPEEIRTLRRQGFAQSRTDFSALTGIGTASLARWESGSVVQSRAYDRYLRLLHDPTVADRLRAIASGSPSSSDPASKMRCFPSLEDHELNDRAVTQFQLQRTG